jgi:hypothetical protein
MMKWIGRVLPKHSANPELTYFVMVGLFSLMVALNKPASATQPPSGLEIDDRSPLPPGEPKRGMLAEKLRIPNTDAAIYKGRKDEKGNPIPNTGIVDFCPVASERENSDEYQAWTSVVQWAKQWSQTELEANAATQLTRDDLLASSRFTYRLDLLRFEGLLTQVRRLNASRSLAELGTHQIYEALVIPVDESPTDVISLVFTELPTTLTALQNHPVEAWLEVNKPAIACGYFFKVKQDPQDGPIPLIIGKSVTIFEKMEDLPSIVPNPAQLDKRLRIYQFIKDDAFIAKGAEGWAEASAWNRLLLHARRYRLDDLEKYARTDLNFADLFLDGRQDYKLDLVLFEGRLIMLRRREPTRKLRDAGLDAYFEGWLVPKDEPRGNPVCIVFTEPPEGIEPSGRVNKWVSFAGYSFKLLRYESSEPDPNNPNQNVIKRAPLLLGRAIRVLPDPDAATPISWDGFLKTAAVSVLVLIGTALGLTWLFRKGDHKTQLEIESHRSRNPFGS